MGSALSLDLDKYIYPVPQSSYKPTSFPELKFIDEDPYIHITPPGARYVMFYCHGNEEDLGMIYPTIKYLAFQLKINVIAIEYPGYGFCRGKCNEISLYRQVCKVFNIFKHVYPHNKIILAGRSMGCAPMIHLATKNTSLAAVILISPYSSLKDVITDKYGTIPSSLIKEKFPNQELIGYIKTPIIIIHGKKDEIVDYHHSMKLLKNVTYQYKKGYTIDDMGHNDVFERNNIDKIIMIIKHHLV